MKMAADKGLANCVLKLCSKIRPNSPAGIVATIISQANFSLESLTFFE